jgi:hypothetical protein
MSSGFNLKEFLSKVQVEGSEGTSLKNPPYPMEIKIADMGFAKKLEEN